MSMPLPSGASGQPFPDQVAPGGVLVYPAVKSPNFASGLSGWSINRDGSAEFNNGTFRGTVTASVFEALNGSQVVLKLDEFGNILAFNPSGALIFAWDTTPKDALLVYADTGGSTQGALIFSVAGVAGTDVFGNPYPQGLNVTKGAISGSTFTGNDFIMNSAGAFFYSGTPASGNLITSITGAAGTDGFGNKYLEGATYYANDGLGTYIQQFNGLVVFGNTAFPDFSSGAVAMSFDNLGTFSMDGLSTGTVSLLQDGTVQIASGAWQNMTLKNGWTVQSGGYARYKLMPDNSVWIQAQLTAGTITNGTTVWNAPAALVPATTAGQTMPLIVASGSPAASGLMPHVSIGSGGSLAVFSVASGTANCSINGRYALD